MHVLGLVYTYVSTNMKIYPRFAGFYKHSSSFPSRSSSIFIHQEEKHRYNRGIDTHAHTHVERVKWEREEGKKAKIFVHKASTYPKNSTTDI